MRAQSRAVCQSHPFSRVTFWMISVSVWLCLSSSPLLQGLYPAVVLVSMLKFSAMSLISSLLNSPPLSLYSFCGAPWTLIQVWMKELTISDDFFVFTMFPALKRVKWSMMWRYHTPGSNSCRSTATVSLYSEAKGSPQLGFVFLYFWHISHLLFVVR